MSIVSNNIKYLRRLNGLTQEQFARKIGIKRSLVGAYEEARANPNLDNLKNMAFVFGVTVDNLVKNDLRKLRETPDLSIPFSASGAVQPRGLEEEEEEPEAAPQFAAIMEKFQQNQVAEIPEKRDFASDLWKPPVEDAGSALPSFSREQPLANREGPHAPAVSDDVIRLVRTKDFYNYLNHNQDRIFLNSLPVIQLPGLTHGVYRAFESGKDFVVPNSILVGASVASPYEVSDGGQYLFVLRNRGMIFRRAYNQMRAKGVLLLSSDAPGTSPLEVSSREILEIWEVKAVVSYQIPESQINMGRVNQLLDDLQRELGRGQ